MTGSTLSWSLLMYLPQNVMRSAGRPARGTALRAVKVLTSHQILPGPMGWILTLHLRYVAVYTCPLLFLFERTHNSPVDDQGLLLWWLQGRCLSESKVRLASLVKVLCDGKISWVLWS